MALWGKAHASATNKPKYFLDDKDSKYDRTHVYANNQGWVVRAGSPSTAATSSSSSDVAAAKAASSGRAFSIYAMPML